MIITYVNQYNINLNLTMCPRYIKSYNHLIEGIRKVAAEMDLIEKGLVRVKTKTHVKDGRVGNIQHIERRRVGVEFMAYLRNY